MTLLSMAMSEPPSKHETNITGDTGHVFSGDFHGTVNVNSPPRPDTSPAFQVPHRALGDAFVGREDDLQRLADLLLAGSAAIVAPAVTGMGGIGKTQLATEFAHRYRDSFPGGVFWLAMEQPESVRGQVAACAGPGGLDRPDYEQLSFDARVQATQAAWRQSTVRLLVFDNLEDPTLLDEWRPQGGGCRVLITSRDATWPAYSGVQPVALRPLEDDSSLELLLTPLARKRRKTVAQLLADQALRTAAQAIVEELGGLPLALTLAGTYLETTGTSLKRYLEQIQKEALQHRSMNAELRNGLPTKHSTSIVATFELSRKQLKADNPTDALALRLWERAAQFAIAPIPMRLLLRASDLDTDDDEQVDQGRIALQRLQSLGLLDEDVETETVSIHRLLATYARSTAVEPKRDREQAREMASDECLAISMAGYPLRGIPYLPHLYSFAEDSEDSTAQALLFGRLGYLLWKQGDLKGAQLYCERNLTIAERVLGPDDPGIAASLNNLGFLLQEQGDLTGARPYLERALVIAEGILGPDDPGTAASLNNMGCLLVKQGDLKGAKPYFERALSIKERVLGSNHPDTALILNNLGYLFLRLGDLTGGRPYLEHALAIWELVLSSDHPDRASSLNNLGALFQDQGDFSGAKPYYERALAIRERILGPEHPNTATSLNNLGALFQDQDDLSGAKPYYERALAICERILGPNHPNTRLVRNNLNTLIADLERANEAQQESENT